MPDRPHSSTRPRSGHAPHPATDPRAPKEPAASEPVTADDVAAEIAAPRRIRLDHFLQRVGLAATGGHAKLLIQNGEVQLNGEVETRRRKQLAPGDVVECSGDTCYVE